MENIAFIQLTERKLELKIIQSRAGRYRILEDVINDYDLTGDITKDCLFSPKSRADILKIMNIYRFTVETFGATKMIAFASNIIVKARNYRGLLDEIYTHTGINFTLSSDEEILKDIYQSVVTKIDCSKGTGVYISGYNTHIFKYNRRSVVDYSILPYGYINLSERTESFNDLVQMMKKELKDSPVSKNFEEEILVGTGLPFLDIAKVEKKLQRYPLDIENNYILSENGVKKVIDFTKDLDIDKIKKIKGLSNEGADSLKGGLAIIKALYEAFEVAEITVSDANCMEGRILENLVGTPTEKYTDLLLNSLDNYYEFRKEGLSVNPSVYNMAVLLFKQLKVVHKLSRAYVKPLKIASYMFDCGKFIDFNNYEKHGYYTILNANIVGATHKEILIAALSCMCQNLDNFNLPEIMKYKDLLDDEDVDAIRKLGVLVKLAVNLNASRKNVISDIICDILGDSIIMKTVVKSDPSFEIMQSMKLADDFKKTFKKSLQII